MRFIESITNFQQKRLKNVKLHVARCETPHERKQL